MKYWFFDGNDVTGPFSLKELLRLKSFSETSLVCPENFSDDGDHWQVAATFDELKPFLVREPQPDEETTTFEQEMASLLKEKSPLAFDETPSEGPGLQIPKKPAKPGPIEDYFNRVKEEDLGDILGIPNPNENSDMDLAHALEKQLAKTSSTRRREREQENEVDEQTVAELKKANQTHHVATVTEVFGPQTPVATPAPTAVSAKEEPTMPVVELPTMPVVTAPATLTTPTTQTATEPEELVPQVTPANTKISTEPAPAQIAPTGTHAADELKPAQIPPETAQEKPEKSPTIVPDPTQLRREKVEVNSIRAGLKQTQEMKDFLRETQNHRLKQELHTQKRVLVMLFTALAIIGGLFLVFELRDKSTVTTKPQATTQELLTEPVATAPKPTPTLATRIPAAAVNPQTTSQESKALEIVKNHPLSGQRGRLADYLNHIYRSQLAQGYTGIWAAEPLYKNIYIVKYQLTKTRKEPIIYIFQADVVQGKLTGALNNISLDLVGKL